MGYVNSLEGIGLKKRKKSGFLGTRSVACCFKPGDSPLSRFSRQGERGAGGGEVSGFPGCRSSQDYHGGRTENCDPTML